MNHPLRASRAPSRGLSLDCGGSVNLHSLAKGRIARFDAACKAARRTGGAGSSGFAPEDLLRGPFGRGVE